MKFSYIFASLTLILWVISLFLSILSFRKKNSLGICLGISLVYAFLVTVSYTFSMLSYTYELFSFSSSVYFICMDFLMLSLTITVFKMVELPASIHMRVLLLIALVYAVFDTVCLAVNPWNDFVVSYELVADSAPKFAYVFHPMYYIHLAYNYILVFSCIVLLSYRILHIPRIYRKYYLNLIYAIFIAVLINAAYLFLRDRFQIAQYDFSIFTYDIVAAFFYYNAFVFNTKKMPEYFRNMILDNIEQGILLFDYHGKLIQFNELSRRMLKKVELRTGTELQEIYSAYKVPEAPSESRNFLIYNENEFTDAVSCVEKEVLYKGSPHGRLMILSDFQSEYDPLTGLKAWENFRRSCVSAEEDFGYPITIVAFAINNMTSINRKYLSYVGDQILIHLSKAIVGAFPENTLVVRYRDARMFAVIRNGVPKDTILEYIRQTRNAFSNEQTWDFPVSFEYATSLVQEGEHIVDAVHEAFHAINAKKLLNPNSNRSQLVSSLLQTLKECDEDTEQHVARTQQMGNQLAQRIGLSDLDQAHLSLLCILHDIGKVGIPLEILNKPGKLDDGEWEIIRSHTQKGYAIAKSSPTLSDVAEMILCHHERWDGKGYPSGIQGENIPLLSRMISIIDAYDAMTNDRVYRKAMPASEAISILVKNSGTQFDPNLVTIFVQYLKDNGISASEQVFSNSTTSENEHGFVDQTNPFIQSELFSKYRVDMEGYITSFDQNFQTLTGYSSDDIQEVHLRHMDLIPEEDLPAYFSQVAEQKKSSGTVVIRHRLKKKNGEIITVHCDGEDHFDPVSKRNEVVITITLIP